MKQLNWKTNVTSISFGLLILGIGSVSAQFDKSAPEKIWQTKQIDVLQSNYRNTNGMPSRDTFLKNHGLFQAEVNYRVSAYFTISFKQNDIVDSNSRLKLIEDAHPVSIDFYLKNDKVYNSPNKLSPLWDGRVYEDNNKIVVGGYSSRHNERPVGRFNDSGKFEVTLDKNLIAEFPILQTPAEAIIFDPFEWRIYKIEPTNGESVREESQQYLPISMYDSQGQLIGGIQFEIKKEENNLVLFGNIDGNVLKIAEAGLDSEIINKREGYQPQLQDGCVQPEGGKVVTLTFKGRFTDNLIAQNDMLFLKNYHHENRKVAKQKRTSIKIDGHFEDWRNIAGISDPKGDYVSYLYPNPDTDILQFKVSNDDKYLYFYSRVAGVHGRTGGKGRYYWYTYIDVDANPNTGYPPTRDDNCYFGIAIGDDCEAQFEFIGNKFIKTFFGFTGMGTEKQSIDGKLTLGPSYYSAKDLQGKMRDRYKVEYVNRNGTRSTTHDYTEGTSEDLIIALSADGSEVEMRAELAGFLWDENGKPIVSTGQIINIAVGAEGSSDFYGSDDWGADSSPVIYGYKIQ